VSPFLRRSAIVVLGAVVLFAVVSIRAVLSARSELGLAEQASAAADTAGELRHLRLAGRWDAPLNPYSARALERLHALAEQAEQRGDLPAALAASRALHAALVASRSPFRSPAVSLDLVDARLARLLAEDDLTRTRGAARPPDPAAVARVRASLVLSRPRTGFVLLAFAGLIAWVFGFASLLLYGLDREGRVVHRIARPSFLFFVFGWVAFAVGLRLA
jgi:hypothetical protein